MFFVQMMLAMSWAIYVDISLRSTNLIYIYIYTYIHNICLYPYVSTYESISEDLQATYALRMAVAADTPPQPHPIYAAGGGGMERNQRNRSTKLEMRINLKKNVG